MAGDPFDFDEREKRPLRKRPSGYPPELRIAAWLFIVLVVVGVAGGSIWWGVWHYKKIEALDAANRLIEDAHRQETDAVRRAIQEFRADKDSVIELNVRLSMHQARLRGISESYEQDREAARQAFRRRYGDHPDLK